MEDTPISDHFPVTTNSQIPVNTTSENTPWAPQKYSLYCQGSMLVRGRKVGGATTARDCHVRCECAWKSLKWTIRNLQQLFLFFHTC